MSTFLFQVAYKINNFFVKCAVSLTIVKTIYESYRRQRGKFFTEIQIQNYDFFYIKYAILLSITVRIKKNL